MILLEERNAVKMMTALGVDAVELASATSVVELMRPRTWLGITGVPLFVASVMGV